MVNYVYFVLVGECKLIEHMIVEEKKFNREIQYNLYNNLETKESRLKKKDMEMRKNQKLTKYSEKFDQDKWSVCKFFYEYKNIVFILF